MRMAVVLGVPLLAEKSENMAECLPAQGVICLIDFYVQPMIDIQAFHAVTWSLMDQ